jgi:hypothetical protein
MSDDTPYDPYVDAWCLLYNYLSSVVRDGEIELKEAKQMLDDSEAIIEEFNGEEEE